MNKREGKQVKEQIMKEAMQNQELMDFVKSLTKTEIKLIKDQREFDTIPVGTTTYKVAVLCDALRQSLRKLKLNISKRLQNMVDLHNNIQRLRQQEVSGIITEEIKHGLKMTMSELMNLIRHNQWLKDGEFYSIPPLLGELRAIAGHKDVSRQIVFTIDEFEDYVGQVSSELEKYGYDLFAELSVR